MERSLLKVTTKDLVEALKKKSYTGSEKFSIYMDDGSSGLGVLRELEIDRVNVFKALYDRSWQSRLTRAHEWVVDGEVEYAVDYILVIMNYGN